MSPASPAPRLEPDCSTQTRAPGLDPLDHLNPAQREAVEHGLADGGAQPSLPLLVIAGAGSGKTSTLAHRVAHLIVHGADPGRMLLLTFSRRAADEMGRRVKRLLAQAVRRPGLASAELAWSGTFHAIGARLLRNVRGWCRSRTPPTRRPSSSTPCWRGARKG
ncbi:UvrD-helicase domain-containing protein [Rhodocyclaceae bacterium SMB388]